MKHVSIHRDHPRSSDRNPILHGVVQMWVVALSIKFHQNCLSGFWGVVTSKFALFYTLRCPLTYKLYHSLCCHIQAAIAVKEGLGIKGLYFMERKRKGVKLVKTLSACRHVKLKLEASLLRSPAACAANSKAAVGISTMFDRPPNFRLYISSFMIRSSDYMSESLSIRQEFQQQLQQLHASLRRAASYIIGHHSKELYTPASLVAVSQCCRTSRIYFFFSFSRGLLSCVCLCVCNFYGLIDNNITGIYHIISQICSLIRKQTSAVRRRLGGDDITRAGGSGSGAVFVVRMRGAAGDEVDRR